MTTIKKGLAARVRDIRVERFGADGTEHLAGLLGLPARTWSNYESGVTIPAEAILQFIAMTGANPLWLLNELGPRYRRGPRGEPRAN
jgi:transcriptional regulator with XRE-family HTH domain